MGGLAEYWRRRDFEKTPEPRGAPPTGPQGELGFVVQKHAARRLHYDFRLELDGVLLSWAVPKGPSLDPSVKRLAVETEDHPIDYRDFEGIIPAGEYGGGTVMVWDRGSWQPEGDPRDGLRRGRLSFRLEGSKLRGTWHLVRTGAQGKKPSWLLFKGSDGEARRDDGDITSVADKSVITDRSLDEIASDPDRVWHSEVDAPDLPDFGALAGSRPGTPPSRLRPCLPTLVREAPDGDDWLHEMKLDGYRLLARVDGDDVTLITRSEQDWSDRFPSLLRALQALELREAVIDGEVVVLDEHGVSDFQALQNSLGGGEDAHIFYAFDMLFAGGHDLRSVALVDRKAALERTLEAARAAPQRIRYSRHVTGRGADFYESACETGLEGIVSKRASSRYEERRSKSWLKVKCSQREELVIGGFTAPGGSRSHLGALLVGVNDGDDLRYAGKVGTGFSERSLGELHQRLAPLARDRAPFVDPPRGAPVRGVTWVEPSLVAEVEHAGFTRDGKLRHPSFQGLRDDKPAAEVRRQRPAPRIELPKKLRLTSPDKVLYPGRGLTKRDLAVYYLRVAEAMLPELRDRPLTLVRCPEGRTRPCFYQKHATASLPEAIRRIAIEEKDGEGIYVAVRDVDGLLALVQLGVLEIHAWGCRSDRVERPDCLVFDLDPDTELPWAETVATAFTVRDRLADLGLTSFVRTTGGKGLHLVAPIGRRTSWDDLKEFSRRVAHDLAHAQPERFTVNMAKARRRGRVYLDYLRNGRGASAICSYSARAREGATVATPLRWDELSPRLRPADFTIETVPDRLERDAGAEAWAGYDDVDQSITRAMRDAVGMP